MANIVEFKEKIDLKETFTIRRFKFAKDPLSWEERLLLQRNWAKLQALIEVTIVSTGAEDRHFLEVFKEKKSQPTTKLELAWAKHHAALEDEKRLKAQWSEQRKNSPETAEYLRSRFSGGRNSEMPERKAAVPTSVAPNGAERKQCFICHGAMEDCWKCGGEGWI